MASVDHILFLLVFSGARLVFDWPSYFQMNTDSDAYSPSPGASSEPAQVPADYSTARQLGAGAKTEPQVSAESPIDVDDNELDVTISNLPEKLGFSKEFLRFSHKFLGLS